MAAVADLITESQQRPTSSDDYVTQGKGLPPGGGRLSPRNPQIKV